MENSNKVDKYQGIIVLVLLMIVIIPAIILNTVDISPHKLIIQDDIIKVGVKSFKVEDININYRIKGTKTLNYLRGLYAIEGENQDANVYIYRNKSPYIRVEFKDGLLIYNDKNSSDTEKNYEKLVEIVNINKYKK